MQETTTSNDTDAKYLKAIENWLDSMVVGLNLCPFARRELDNDKVRFSVSDANTDQDLLDTLLQELLLLDSTPAIETTLLIHPHVLQDFHDYTLFLPRTNRVIKSNGWKGVYQIASFHPQYQFAGCEPDDCENYTNRAPYPVLHLLRENSLERAIDSHPNTADIPERNIQLMNDMGREQLQTLWQANYRE